MTICDFYRASLSARRAWIEISAEDIATSNWSVALRKESVDRNHGLHLTFKTDGQSLSARRAWIEISFYAASTILRMSRSPQGERG